MKNPDPRHHGWAVSPKLTEPHVAVFSTDAPVELPAGSELIVKLDHQFEYAYPGFSPWAVSRVGDGCSRSVDFGRRAERCSGGCGEGGGGASAEEQKKVSEYFASVAPAKTAVRDELLKLKAELAGIKSATVPIFRDLPEGKRRETRIHNRGNFLDPGEKIEAGVLPAFHALPQGAPLNRLGVAQWICSRDNPLTARVAVNRIWAGLFGTGLVETQEDFGTQGAAADASGIAGLAGGGVHGRRLVVEEAAEDDRDVGDLSAVIARDAGTGRAGSVQPAAGARAALPAGGGSDSRRVAGGRRAAEPEDVRAFGDAVSAGGAVEVDVQR